MGTARLPTRAAGSLRLVRLAVGRRHHSRRQCSRRSEQQRQPGQQLRTSIGSGLHLRARRPGQLVAAGPLRGIQHRARRCFRSLRVAVGRRSHPGRRRRWHRLGDQADDSTFEAGAVYVYTRDGQNAWSQEAYVKAPSARLERTAPRRALAAISSSTPNGNPAPSSSTDSRMTSRVRSFIKFALTRSCRNYGVPHRHRVPCPK